MGFAGTIAYGLKRFIGNDDIIIDSNDAELPDELKASLDKVDENAKRLQKGVEEGVVVHASERVITAVNVPVIGSIIGWLKIRKANSQLENARASKEAQESTKLNQDGVVKAAVETNAFTNPNGANVVKTKAAIKGDTSNPREQGGEIRTRKGR